MGHYSGFQFDHSVEGDVDITACDDDKICVRSAMSHVCTRWYSSVAERETYRVVDVNGQRAVIGLTYSTTRSIRTDEGGTRRLRLDRIQVRQVTS